MGPLDGVRVLQIGGLGAVPFTGMLLADMGADVVRVDRPTSATAPAADGYEKRWRSSDPRAYVLDRGRRSVVVDLKAPAGRGLVLELVGSADALLEGFRPGVMERLGLGPDECLTRKPSLVYGRLTGWGQSGPLAMRAGHDLTYLAITGALHGLATSAGTPITPPGLVADFGGGGLMLAFGLVTALLHARLTGTGQVVDTAMIDGVSSLTTLLHGLLAQGRWSEQPGTNFSDGGAPFYSVYETSDGRHVAVGANESQFYAELIGRLGLDASTIPSRDDEKQWPALRELFAEVFASRTMWEWAEEFADSDGCVAPILSLTEAPLHPHNVARSTFVTRWGVTQPAPTPRMSATPGDLSLPPPLPGEHSVEALRDWGIEPEAVTSLIDDGVVAQAVVAP